MSRSVQDSLEAASDAMRRHAWEEARGLLAEADAKGALDAEGLRQFGKALDWCGDAAGELDAYERSYAAFVAAGDRRRAAKVALMIRFVCANGLRDIAAARGWGQRAERLLESEPECAELGFLWRSQGRRAFLDGKPEEGRALLQKAIELGNRLGHANLAAMSLSWLGVSLADIGRSEEAFPYLDEACAAAVGGELGPWATGIVYCNTIGAYRAAGEFGVASEWTQTAGRWCQRESITGFPGICRVHRAEFMRLRGAWADAEREATVARGELVTVPAFAGDAYYEIGEVRLRMGDLAGAETAFRQAHALFRDPQPGAALVLVAQGEPAAALRSLETTLESKQLDALDDMRCLAAVVDIACALGDIKRAEEAVQRVESMAQGQRGLGLQVLALQARGTVEVAKGNPDAHTILSRAMRMWQEIDAPYEMAMVRLLLARALRQTGDAAGALRECEAALATFERLGAQRDATRARELASAPATPTKTMATRTLLFSDIVGSTQLVEAMGDDAWADLVVWLDAAMRECFAGHGGEEVDHAGDGFFVAFPDPTAALDCAVQIQRRLADHRRQHGFAPRLRMGIHATSASHSSGRYRGRGVHEASRIASLAGPDEIIASRASVPPEFSVTDPKTVTVKGISRPLEVVTVDWKPKPA
ncbi:MAG TPA: adenylate/guanylate cyclase domain-containing protein [Candidatus Dormibacteraeota bacterium]|nr:adenylate/guanylate cyclase domain-containing protein [Candidatus Dormibacteraeota bacterium]